MAICPRDSYVAVNTREVSSNRKGRMIFFRLTDESRFSFKQTMSLPSSCSGFFQAMKFTDYYAPSGLSKDCTKKVGVDSTAASVSIVGTKVS